MENSDPSSHLNNTTKQAKLRREGEWEDTVLSITTIQAKRKEGDEGEHSNIHGKTLSFPASLKRRN